ncbi:hypothetical protein [Dysgonomonas sp.]|uniref:hypothetical protein n=1 Tax=Dysgonomonas sp. TaxID=1891233 RepID=UPI0027BA17F1|nr:hypothetical protein [Dysgonomonas sp.]
MSETKTIKQLKKGDRFSFNDKEYLVTKKYVDDDHPLKATYDGGWYEDLFHYEGLEVKVIK